MTFIHQLPDGLDVIVSNAGLSIRRSIYLPLVRTPMIEPTPAYRKAPAMSPGHAADVICRTMYTHKRTYKPWWLLFGQLGSMIFRGMWELAAPWIIRNRRK